MNTETIEREPNSLVLVEPPRAADALAVFAAKDTTKADWILDVVRAKIKEFNEMKPDVSTPAGRALIRSFAARIAKSKTAIEDVGKALAAEQKEIPKRIDATRRHFKDALDAMRDEVRAPLDAWEAAEQERADRIKDELAKLQLPIDDRGERSSEALRDWLDAIEQITLTEDAFADYLGAATELKAKATAILAERIAAAEKREAEAAELAKLRAFAAAQERKDREAKIAEEAAAKAKAEAAAALERAQRDKEEAEARAVRAVAQAKADAEREAAARQQREAADQREREADRAHRAQIHRTALDAMVEGGIAEDIAKIVITLIATGKVPAINIRY